MIEKLVCTIQALAALAADKVSKPGRLGGQAIKLLSQPPLLGQ